MKAVTKIAIAAVAIAAAGAANAGMTKVGHTLDHGTVYAELNGNVTTMKLVRADKSVVTGKYEINCAKSAYKKVGNSYWERFDNQTSAVFVVVKATCDANQLAMRTVDNKMPGAVDYDNTTFGAASKVHNFAGTKGYGYVKVEE